MATKRPKAQQDSCFDLCYAATACCIDNLLLNLTKILIKMASLSIAPARSADVRGAALRLDLAGEAPPQGTLRKAISVYENSSSRSHFLIGQPAFVCRNCISPLSDLSRSVRFLARGITETVTGAATAVVGQESRSRLKIRTGRSPYFWTVLRKPGERVARLREGLNASARIILLGLAMDVTYQAIELKTFYPVEALIIALLLAFVPYLLIRGPSHQGS